MLYHVPELARALAEISRVLKPGGRLYASTIGETHLREIDKLIQQVVPDAGWWGNKVNTSFTLEKGREVLSPCIGRKEMRAACQALMCYVAGTHRLGFYLQMQ